MVWMELCSRISWALGWCCGKEGLRWRHAALLDDELADLEGDASVVHGLGDHAWWSLAWCACCSAVVVQSFRCNRRAARWRWTAVETRHSTLASAPHPRH